MQKIAIIGAKGQLGFDLTRVLGQNKNFILFPLTRLQCDITIKKSVVKSIDSIGPDIVISTAAYHKVDEVETNPKKAFLVNSLATMELARICEERGITFVFISTDYVFGQDEKRTVPYREHDPTGPINAYGNSKLSGENFVRSICSKYFIIRSTGLFGVAGASGKGGNFVELMLKLAHEKREISVVRDQVLSPTYTLDLAKTTSALLQTKYYGLYHAVSDGECSWFTFAAKIFELTKTKAELKPTTSADRPTGAKRPYYSVLENYNLGKIKLNKMNSWEVNLGLYLKEKGYI